MSWACSTDPRSHGLGTIRVERNGSCYLGQLCPFTEGPWDLRCERMRPGASCKLVGSAQVRTRWLQPWPSSCSSLFRTSGSGQPHGPVKGTPTWRDQDAHPPSLCLEVSLRVGEVGDREDHSAGLSVVTTAPWIWHRRLWNVCSFLGSLFREQHPPTHFAFPPCAHP